MGVFSRTVPEQDIGIIVRNYDEDVLSVNSRFLDLAGVSKNASNFLISHRRCRGRHLNGEVALLST